MLKILKNDGFASMVEVIVSAIFFIIASFGIFTSISMLRPQGVESEKRLEALYVGKGVIDNLRSQIDASTWDTPGSIFEPDTLQSEVIGDYTVNYVLIDRPDLGMRELVMNVSW